MQNTSSNAPADEAGNRPKVLRRPAQFSRKSAPVVAVPDTTPLVVSTPRVAKQAPVSTATAWQEDGRFGVMLIVVVALINLLLSLLLPLIGKPQHAGNTLRTTTINSNASMPSAMSTGQPSGVTVYSDPTDAAARDGMDIDQLPEDYNEFTTSPKDMPAPTARRVDEDDR